MNERNTPIAVVGVSTLFPGSVDATGFWKDILEGSDLITDVPPSHWLIEDYYDPDPTAHDKTYAKRGAFIPKMAFDPMAWGVPPSTIPATDTCQLLALIVAQRVLEDAAQGQFDYSDRERMSVILGVTSTQELLGSMVSRLQRPVWTKSLREMGLPESEVQEACERIEAHYTPWQEATFPGVLGNVVAGRIANRLDLGGTNCVTDAACASTFSALSMAINELTVGQSDVVICGGADTMNDIFMYLCFSKTPALSKSGDCRPFSDKADGTMLGEGFGMVALKRLDQAEQDGDRIYAVIRGVGSSSDGAGTAVYAPVPAGQAKAIRRAYAKAGFGAETVELVEAHGTGTIAGDAAEFEGLRSVFDESGREDRQWCAVGSVKSQIGHTKASAGAAGLVKGILALHHRVLPPTIKVDAPNPKLRLEESPFHINTTARPWIRDDAHPRRAGVSSFGFGGSNFHVALEEYTGDSPAYRRRANPTELFVVTGASPAAVAADARAMAEGAAADGMFHFWARETQEGYDANAECRLALVAEDGAQLAAKLGKAATLVEAGEAFATPDGIVFGIGAPDGDVGFVFPGQGSQYVGMGADVAMTWDDARAPWDAAANLDVFDTPLHHVAFPRTAFDDASRDAQVEKLTATEWAQPAIGVTSLSHLDLLTHIGLAPKAVTGHSFGEVMALCAAGCLSPDDAVRVARRRGELMAEAAKTPGAMTAVSASADVVRDKLEEWGTDVVLANHNGPKQVVVSGPTAAIEAVEVQLAAAKMRFQRLPVATAFHSKVVSSSTGPLREHLEGIDFAAPKVPVYGNTEAAPYPSAPGQMRDVLANQLAQSVRFVESIEAMYQAGVRTFVEVGPGSVLTGLVGRILAGRPHRAVALDRKGKHGVTSLNQALAHLVGAGIPLELAALWQAFAPVEDPRATKKPKLTVDLGGSNVGKPYPPENGAAGVPKPNPERVRAAAPSPAPAAKSPAPSVAAGPAPVAPQPQVAPTTPQHVAPVAAHSVAPPVAGPAAPPAAEGDAWASAYYAIQSKAIEAHTAYTQAMATTHSAFLAAQQGAMAQLPGMMTGTMTGQPMQALPANPAAYVAAPQPHVPVPAPAPVAQTAAASQHVPRVAAPAPVAAPAAAPVSAPATVAVAAAPSVDLQALMLEVVSDKTGYPVEMLELSMDLAGDLGVDSIKRVEILAAMKERASSLPEVDPAELGKLRTLQEIVDRMQAAGGVRASTPAAPAATPAAVPSASPSVDLQALMLEVVSEKTGYPVEMLELSMDLAGDLGVDSIKRVEILAAMKERASDLPEVDPAELGKLRTLQEIVDRMQVAGGALAPAATAAAAAPVAVPSVDLQALMLEVVSEKTGYPVEMLELSMDLAGDLGVDSIKRVEILAAMKERASDLPEVDPAELGKLRTLQEIVDRMQVAGSGGSAPSIDADAGSAQTSTAAVVPEDMRWALRLEAAPANGFALRGLLTAKAVAVIDGGSGLGALVAEGLVRSGVGAVAAAPSAQSDGVIDLSGLAELETVEDALRIQRQAFEAAKAVSGRLTQGPGVFVTVQDTGGDFGLGGQRDPKRAWLGGLPGLVKTAAQEWPEAGVRAIDLERGGRDARGLAEAIVSELLRGGRAQRPGAAGAGAEVALRADGARHTLVSYAEKVAVAEDGARIDQDSVIVASGGARGVTATTLIALAKATRARFVLLGRTALEDEPASCAGATTDAVIKQALLADAKRTGAAVKPAELGARAKRILAGREVRQTLGAIEAAGGQARYVAVSVTDRGALGAALSEVRQAWGPITGVVHGAGLIADKFIADKPLEDWVRVFDTKVRGLGALLDATADDPLSVLIAFSSVAGRCGNRGQSDYAMANETLNKVLIAESQRRGSGFFARSLGWGPWEGGMVTPALKQHFESLGVPLIPLAVGAQMLVDEVLDTSASVELVLGGEPRAEALSDPNGDQSRPHVFELLIDRDSFPAIDDHRVKGKPVLPIALVVEVIARAVEAMRPELVFASVDDLKVLRGVTLDHFEDGGDAFAVRVTQVSNGDGVVFRTELVDAAGHVRYSARATAKRHALSRGSIPPRPEGLTPFVGTVYDGTTLFHGKAFQVIVDAPEVGEAGLEAVLMGTASRDWAAGEWATDPALVDGALQLALLWTSHVEGGSPLPTSLVSYRRFTRGLARGPIKAILNVVEHHTDRSVTNVVLVDGVGTPFAELVGVEMHVLPGSRSTDSVHA